MKSNLGLVLAPTASSMPRLTRICDCRNANVYQEIVVLEMCTTPLRSRDVTEPLMVIRHETLW